MIYAGFWRRFAAYWIDAFPIFLVTGLVFYFFLGFDETVRAYWHGPKDIESRELFLAERNHIRDLSLALWMIYGVLMDASRLQGTFGKRLMGMCVVDEAGGRLSFKRALARNAGKILSALPLFLGFLWIGWSKTKQGWHDRMSHCFIVRIPKETGSPACLHPYRVNRAG
ncbi:MAG: RDD family protein [Deltaproteobacteria bacterium]|nr:RDD family protein [Deltaproteobacteria bacterium]